MKMSTNKRGIVIETTTIKGLIEAALMALDANNTTAARLLVSGILTEIEVAELRGVKMPRDRRTTKQEVASHDQA